MSQVRKKKAIYAMCVYRKIVARWDICSAGTYFAWINFAANREASINNVALNTHQCVQFIIIIIIIIIIFLINYLVIKH